MIFLAPLRIALPAAQAALHTATRPQRLRPAEERPSVPPIRQWGVPK